MAIQSRSNRLGFTLIELMIALAIVAILAAIAYPSYRQHVLRTHRTEGKALLQRIAGEQERFFTARSQYTSSLTGANPNGLGFANNQSENGCYQATITLGAGNLSYVLRAVPVNSTACGNQTQDTQCGTLTIDNLGNRSATGPLGADCW